MVISILASSNRTFGDKLVIVTWVELSNNKKPEFFFRKDGPYKTVYNYYNQSNLRYKKYFYKHEIQSQSDKFFLFLETV